MENLIELGHDEFGARVERHRRELLAHCYRMTGSVQDAEDLVQETFLRAWRHRATFAGRASLRSWLYKIATNACLDALDRRPRRSIPALREAASSAADPIPADVLEPIWLEPFPDDLLDTEADSPEARVSARESITLAFVAALHRLPPRQRAVLILRDVLDWSANEVADLLETTVAAVKSALHRARSTLASGSQPIEAGAALLDRQGQRRLEDYVSAWERADVPALLRLLKEDATFSMPPIPSWYRGRESIGTLVTKTVFRGQAAGRWRLIPTHANRQPAFGLYRCDEAVNLYRAYGIQVLTLHGSAIADVITFRNPALFARFHLPDSLAP